ncbi:hypothetical protein BH09ACT8_BH09ACT8_65400 [soil metagenome]
MDDDRRCALLVFIAISVVYIVIVFMRRLKANGLPDPPGYARDG